jgi:hypothetical protein
MRNLLVFAAVLYLFSGSTIYADDEADKKSCFYEGATPDELFAACGRLTESTNLSDEKKSDSLL